MSVCEREREIQFLTVSEVQVGFLGNMEISGKVFSRRVVFLIFRVSAGLQKVSGSS